MGFKGIKLFLLTLSVSLGIFMNVLDTAIANVAIPTIAGDIGVSVDQGTWIITSFTVSMAIVMPLTGWLAKRFGEVRLYVVCTLLFAFVSVLCGLANSLPTLVICRVLQGIVAGPMIPLSQSLLLANFPEDKKGLATGLWTMVAVAAPVLGPILGGYITDNIAWPWIFYINLPVGLFAAYFTWDLLANSESKIEKKPVDYVGLILLAIGIGSLQLLLDKGQDLDWFNSNVIIALAIISTLSLIYFITWELTEKNPIVDLSLFKIRNFAIGTFSISLGYMVFFGSVVILPLWLQTQMNYTPTWAGLVTAPIGLIPIILSPILGRIMAKVDLRMLMSLGFMIFAYCSFWIAHFNTQVDAGSIALIRFIQGFGIPLFFIPGTAILLSGLSPTQITHAAGLSNFMRILAGSFGTSIAVSMWSNRESLHQNTLVENLTTYNAYLDQMIQYFENNNLTQNEALVQTLRIIMNQSYMMATNDIFWVSGILFTLLMVFIWSSKPPFLAKSSQPKPTTIEP